MPEETFQEKTELATPRKRHKAREEGQVAKSVEISSVFVMLAGIGLLLFLAGPYGKVVSEMMAISFTFDRIPLFDTAHCITLFHQHASYFLQMVLPVMGAVVLVALVVNAAQVGLVFSAKAIEPKLSKISIIKGFKRFFSLRSLVELIKAIIKLAAIGTVTYFVIKAESGQFLHLHELGVAHILAYILRVIFKLFLWVLLIMFVMAAADYVYQRWQFEQQLKMTKQEVKEEHKQTEGDPQVKARIRSIQYQAARRRMMQQVPEADVVVTNPTHLALALRYDPAAMSAPRVVAKGAGHVAERIKDIAASHGIPVVENKKLAQNLYRYVKIGEEVPVQLYQAVAELLAYVYKLKGKTAG